MSDFDYLSYPEFESPEDENPWAALQQMIIECETALEEQGALLDDLIVRVEALEGGQEAGQ